MAKMLAKQIDHARKRVSALAAAKRGSAPVRPKYVDPSDLQKEIENGEREVGGTLLRNAFKRLVNGTKVTLVEEGGSWYDYTHRKSRRHADTVENQAPSSIFQAIRDELYAVEMAEAHQVWLDQKNAYDAKVARIKARAEEVEDFIVLGDVHTALQALKDFEAWEDA